MRFTELSSSDWRRISHFVGEMNECSDSNAIETFLHLRLRDLVDGDVTVWNEISAEGNINYASTFPDFGEQFWNRLAPSIASNIQQHPFALDYLRSRPMLHASRWSDYPSYKSFLKSELYNEPFNVWDCKHVCIGAVKSSRDAHLAFQVNRAKGNFRLKDLQIFQVLIPHFSVAYQRLRTLDSIERSILSNLAGDNIDSVFWLSLGPSLHIKNASSNAITTITNNIAKPETAFQLPHELRERLRSFVGAWGKNKISDSNRTASFKITSGSNQFTFEFQQLEAQGFQLTGRQRMSSDHSLLARSLREQLSNREYEICLWACKGKTNPEIAIILGIRVKTVEKHLTSIFRKLAIPDRRKLIASFGSRSCPR